MIKEFKNLPCRDTAVIYQSNFEQIKMLFEVNPQLAGELAISIIEMALCGEISSDDFTIRLALQDFKKITSKNKNSYEKKVATKKQNRIVELKLEEIAFLKSQNYTQQEIGEKLGITQQVVNYRLGLIRSEYPELLNTKNTKITKKEDVCNFCTNLYFSENFCKNDDNHDNLQKIQKLQTKQKKQMHVDVDVDDDVDVDENLSNDFSEQEYERAYYTRKQNLKGTITLSELQGQKFNYLGKHKLFVRIQGQDGIYELIN